MKCPHCQRQDQSRSVKAVYAAGTNTAVTHSSGSWSGVGYGSQGLSVMGGPVSSTATTHASTRLARTLAPPRFTPQGTGFRNLVLWLGIPAGGLGLLMAGYIGGALDLVVVLGPVFLIRRLWQISPPGRTSAAKSEERQRLEGYRHWVWESTWYCGRCHTIFWPAFAQLVVAAQIAPIQRPEALAWSLDRLAAAGRGLLIEQEAAKRLEAAAG